MENKNEKINREIILTILNDNSIDLPLEEINKIKLLSNEIRNNHINNFGFPLNAEDSVAYKIISKFVSTKIKKIDFDNTLDNNQLQKMVLYLQIVESFSLFETYEEILKIISKTNNSEIHKICFDIFNIFVKNICGFVFIKDWKKVVFSDIPSYFEEINDIYDFLTEIYTDLEKIIHSNHKKNFSTSQDYIDYRKQLAINIQSISIDIITAKYSILDKFILEDSVRETWS